MNQDGRGGMAGGFRLSLVDPFTATVARIYNSEFISLVDELLANQPVFDRSPHIAAFD